MQPESSKDPGGISIQKLKEACELVTITKQRRHIFLNETKRTLKRGFTNSKVRLSGLRPEPFQVSEFIHLILLLFLYFVLR